MRTATLRAASVRNVDGPTLIIIITAVGFGTVPFFARSLTQAGMTPAAVAFYRYAFSALAFAPCLRLGRMSWRASAWGIFSGIIVGLGWIGYVRALETLPVSTAGVIYMTYPVFTVLIGWLCFGERPGRRALVAAATVCAASVLAISPAAIGTDQASAVLFAFLAPLGFAVGINILARKLAGIPPMSRMACKSLGSVAGLLPLILTTPFVRVLPHSGSGWALIAGIALVTALLPQLLYNVYVPVIGAARTAMAGSMELPTMFVIGWLAFGEKLNFLQVLAGGMVVSAILMTPAARTRNAPASARALQSDGS
jgi:drug/metabolite transporter (DMT)-like permease